MSDATEAWEKWHHENIDLLHQLDGRERDEAIFAAGQVAVLEEAQGAKMKCRCSDECDVERPVFIAHMRDWLRDRAAELGGSHAEQEQEQVDRAEGEEHAGRDSVVSGHDPDPTPNGDENE